MDDLNKAINKLNILLEKLDNHANLLANAKKNEQEKIQMGKKLNSLTRIKSLALEKVDETIQELELLIKDSEKDRDQENGWSRRNY